MPQFDQCHDQVVRALEKDGWRLESSSVHLRVERRTAFLDAQFSRGANGSQVSLLLVEIKCFPNVDAYTSELYGAIGQ